MTKVCGYANHETFTVVMDIDNNGLEHQRRFLDMAAEVLASDIPPDMVRQKLADNLEDHIRELCTTALRDTPVGALPACLMSSALGSVDWLEVANDLLEKLEDAEYDKLGV